MKSWNCPNEIPSSESLPSPTTLLQQRKPRVHHASATSTSYVDVYSAVSG
eukprot:m.590402 g.590402  ORF g.590402 m.590402 type:complete len:50 (+) comp22376_c0_seq32:3511-3660(+)